MKPQMLVAGVGNIFNADDGFGVEVVTALKHRSPPDWVSIIDFGIRGFDLAYAILDGGFDHILLVDTVNRGGAPGTLYLIEPDPKDFEAERSRYGATPDTHGIDPARVLGWVHAMGGRLDSVRVLGCEPADLGSIDDVRMGLSKPVQESVSRAVTLIEKVYWGEEAVCTS